MEVFRSIFAESSSESEPDDPEQQNPSSSDTAVMETELIQTTGTIDTVRKKQTETAIAGQNFALVTLPSQPPPVATTAASFLDTNTRREAGRNLTTVQRYQHQVIPDNNYFYQLQNPVAETPSSGSHFGVLTSLFGPPLPLPTGFVVLWLVKYSHSNFLPWYTCSCTVSLKTVVLKAREILTPLGQSILVISLSLPQAQKH